MSTLHHVTFVCDNPSCPNTVKAWVPLMVIMKDSSLTLGVEDQRPALHIDFLPPGWRLSKSYGRNQNTYCGEACVKEHDR